MNALHSGRMLGLASLLCILWLLFLDLDRTSPGPLSATHAGQADLVAGTGCALCHGTQPDEMAAACGACHAAISVNLELGSGLHGSLPEVGDCGACHIEHHGADYPLVNDASFRTAGSPSRNEFDHALLGYALEGEHASLGCVECHALADEERLEPGESRFLGLSRDCASCHDDAHSGRMQRACVDCHDQVRAFADVVAFTHERFDGGGAHGPPSCTTCHEPESEHSVGAVGALEVEYAPRSCSECHDSAHDRGFLDLASSSASSPVEESCALCHDPRHESFRDHRRAMPVELHEACAFSLAAPHGELRCDACHVATQESSFADRFPGRTQEACQACHADAHAGQFEQEGATACDACHQGAAFVPSTFDVRQHDHSPFPLKGSHRAVPCGDCHRVDENAHGRTFRGTATSCEGCHTDAHRGRVLPGRDADAGCERCHTSTLFEQFRPSFNHRSATGWKLAGAHADVSCELCHPRSPTADEHGRRFGFVRDLFGPPEECASCHVDAHRGAFATQDGRPASDCSECHVPSSFRDLVEPFDHDERTGYALDVQHAGVACADCHVQDAASARDSKGERRLGWAAGRECADCHAAPHVGQFVREGSTDCARCHSETSGLTFDHRDARFLLDEQHAGLECADCHRSWPLAGGGSAVRYRPLGITCVDCHGPDGTPDRSGREGRR